VLWLVRETVGADKVIGSRLAAGCRQVRCRRGRWSSRPRV